MPSDAVAKVKTNFSLLVHHREPVPLLATLLSLFCAVSVALSSEAVGISLGGGCKTDNFNGCYMEVSVFLPPARALQAFLAASLAIVLCIAIFLWGWQSGISMPPGSMLATGALIQSNGLRELFRSIRVGEDGKISDKDIFAKLAGKRLALDYFPDPAQPGALEYGIIVETDEGDDSTSESNFATKKQKSTWASHFIPLNWFNHRQISMDRWLDCGGLLSLCGLTILIIYYNVTQLEDTAFEQFMNRQSFGVRVLFTAFGVLISLFWDHYHSRESAVACTFICFTSKGLLSDYV
jgi:hypothetical protein